MLNARNIKTKRPSKSLDHKNLGPFPITRVINNSAYELRLPQSINGTFPVFHPWLLHKTAGDPLLGQKKLPPPPIYTDDEGDTYYDVDEISESKIDGRRKDPLTGAKGCLMYRFKYTNTDKLADWQPYTDTAGYQDLVADYYHKYLERVGPYLSFKIPED